MRECGKKNKAVFLDRDGTVNAEKDYLYRIEDFEFLPGVIDALRLLQSAGYLLIIITNQSGIARGYYTLDDYEKLNEWMLGTLEGEGVHIDGVYFCPHHPEAKAESFRLDCDCRKPKPGMFMRAADDFDIDFSRSFAVGDKLRDCAICEITGCRGFLLDGNEREETVRSVRAGEVRRVSYACDLYDAANRIIAAENE